MSEEEVYELLEKVRIYYQNMAKTDAVNDEWYRILKKYNRDDVYSNLEKYLSIERNRNRIPMPQDLAKGLLTIEQQKTKSKDNFKIDCQLCHRFMTLEEYNNHYSKCSSVTYLLKIFEKRDMNVSREELENLDEKTFRGVYEKYKENPPRKEEIYKTIENALYEEKLL